MPFPMTHLYIAHSILSNTQQIKKPGEFLLGAIAPDSVHFRVNYNSDMKKISHLCIGEEKWGRVTNNNEWLKNVLTFLQENKSTEKRDFIYGYCCHIIADIQNNIKIWTPFLQENKEAIEKGLGSAYHKESYEIDNALYLVNSGQKEIWSMLDGAKGYTIVNVVASDDIEKMKYDLLYNQYKNEKPVDISLNKYVTLSTIQKFISLEAQYIEKLLFNVE